MLRTATIPQSLRRICRDILAARVNDKCGEVVGLISALPKEGVSTIAVALARILGESSKVLLIDASAGRPVSKLIGVKSKPLGAKDLAPSAPLSLDDWITPSPALRIDLLTLEVDQHSANLWGRRWPEFKLLFMQRYQLVIVDLGSLQTQLSPFWSTCLDHTYVVVDMSRTGIETLHEARKEIDLLQLPLAGAIANRRSFAIPALLGGG